MWKIIEKAIVEATNKPFIIKEKQRVTGGDINTAFLLSDQDSSYFIKLNEKQHSALFEAESYSLNQISQQTDLRCPEVICSGQTMDKSFLVLEALSFITPNDDDWKSLGKAIAKMHKDTQHGQYGWQDDNYIGLNLQANKWSSNWSTFFAEQRIGWQLQLLNEKSISLGNIEHITTVCHDALLHHHVTPCLVHGDLWQGNVGFTTDGPCVFDPACYYGDREADIAMTELFGHFPAPFYQGYQEDYPLPKHYEERKQVYNLYHMLNHANLFGGVYIEQSKAILQRLLSTTFSAH